MPSIRLMLWGALGAILLLNYEAWMHDYQPAAPIAAVGSAASTSAAPANTLGQTVPNAATAAAASSAAPATTPSPAPSAPASAIEAHAASTSGEAAGSVRVTTDVFDIEINLKGGELERADLLAYPLRKDTPNVPVRLLSHEPAPTLYLLQSGLTGTAGEAAPTHLAIWQSGQKVFNLAP
ncbi:MAG TPA: membrane protein insertase YidC, partial [Steroidobacteraceae bacterium]